MVDDMPRSLGFLKAHSWHPYNAFSVCVSLIHRLWLFIRFLLSILNIRNKSNSTSWQCVIGTFVKQRLKSIKNAYGRTYLEGKRFWSSLKAKSRGKYFWLSSWARLIDLLGSFLFTLYSPFMLSSLEFWLIQGIVHKREDGLKVSVKYLRSLSLQWHSNIFSLKC